ncbi:MAG: ribonuclease T [Sphingomonadaceae bacterium]|nr:ribonuclease T [Sphingomonadaceae bacterium]
MLRDSRHIRSALLALAALHIGACSLPGARAQEEGQRETAVGDAPQRACGLPADFAMPHAENPSAGQVRRRTIGGYTLALSWSPGVCARANRGDGDAPDAMQCGADAPSFGFVLHGLWPEGTAPRDWPQYCAPAPVIDRATIRRHLCMTPDPQLLQHEWERHGACMRDNAADYFDTAAALYQRVHMPDMTRLIADGGDVAGLKRAFVTANPQLPTAAIAVSASRNGWLSEVQICLDTQMQYSPCPAWKRGAPDHVAIRVEPRR